MKKHILFSHPIPRFKRWSRTPYGIFASLHRRVEIGVLCAGMSILLSPTAAKGQSVDTVGVSRRIMLETVSVRGSKSAPPRSVTSTRRLFTSRDVGSAATRTVESVLRTTPSVDVRNRGAEGVQADISIRGGSVDQTMVRLNGIDFTDVRTGHQSHSLPVDLDNVDRIEINDALSSVGAYSGAVDFKVQPAERNTLRAAFTGGAHRFGYANLSGTLSGDNTSFFGAGSFKRSDGYRPNTDFDNLNLYGRMIFTKSDIGVVDMQAGYQNRDFGANGFYSLKYPDQFEHTYTFLTSVRYVGSLSERWSMVGSLSYRRNHDRFELIRGDPETVPFNYHLTDNFGAKLCFDRTGRFGKSSIGGDYALNYLYSTVLGEPLAAPRHFTGQSVAYHKGGIRRTADFWVRHSLPLGDFNLTACGGAALTSYGASAMWSAAGSYRCKWINLELSAVRSMRLPTFTDLYYTATGYVGSPDLVPERALTFRFAVDCAVAGFTLSSTLYYRKGENVIDWVKNSAENDWHSTQSTRLDTYGGELTISREFEHMPFSHVRFCYGHIMTDKQSVVAISKYSLDYMRNKLSLSISSSPLWGFVFTLEGAFFDRNGKYADLSGTVCDYRPYVLIDADLRWHCGKVDLFIDATNLTAAEYFDFGGLPMPRREMKLGLAVVI